MGQYGQLHTHTPASDGTVTVEDIIKADLGFVAITDHDTIANAEPYRRALVEHGIELIPGIEISIQHKGENMHLLCYWPHFSTGAHKMLEEHKQRRLERAIKMLKELEKEEFVVPPMVYGTIKNMNGTISKGQVADIVIYEPANASRLAKLNITAETNNTAARDRFINEHIIAGKPAHIKLDGLPLEKVLKHVSGTFVLAHPGHDLDCKNPEHDAIIEDMAHNYGLVAIESGSRKHSAEENAHYARLGHTLGLVRLQSSDAHLPCQLRQGMMERSVLDELYCCKPSIKSRMNAPSP